MSARDDDDADLREVFAALRGEDGRNTPPFEVPRAAPEAAPAGRRAAGMAALLVAASVLAALFVGRGVDRRDPAFGLSLASEPWTAPTDFLLKTPGFEVLATTPRIGAPPRLALLEDVARSGVPPH